MTAELRIGDTEREAAVAALGEHFAAGRLEKEEYDERTAAAWTARTSGALAPLFDDLPEPHATSEDVSTRTVLTSKGPAPRSYRAGGSRRGYALATLALVALLVALVVADTIPWFVAAIVAWVAFVKLTRGVWYSHPGRAMSGCR